MRFQLPNHPTARLAADDTDATPCTLASVDYWTQWLEGYGYEARRVNTATPSAYVVDVLSADGDSLGWLNIGARN